MEIGVAEFSVQITVERERTPTKSFIEFKREDIERSIPDRFEEQVRRYPHRLAVKTKIQSLTYQQLNVASNKVAHSILARRGQSDEPIALLSKQGVSMIVASLGVLKAGRPYVPINSSLPRAKAIQILKAVEARLVVTDDDQISVAHELAGGSSNVLNVDDLNSDLSGDNPGISISPDQIAYINYTSGSTGEPKGVVWNHRNELFGTRVKTKELHISPDDRVSLLRSNNVGAARDMFLALLNGAALLPFDLNEEGLTYLGNWLLEEDITVYTCVATVFRHSMRSLTGNNKFPKVRLIHIGGEPISKADVELYKKHFSDGCIFVSRFSISETQAVSYYFIDKQTEIKGERVPVGYPLEGNEILLLDDNGNELGVNQIGEIAVKSPYLALGYWRQPELTRAKFLPDPNGGSARTYLTGDLGYRLPDGCLIHMGRKDFQAKIRGHRVEVSAIEMALLDIPTIKQVAVVPRDDLGKDKRLAAYVVPQPGQAPTSGELRGLLKEKLPSYMLPSAFVMLDSLPLTASGKVDRRTLPPPGRSRRGLDNRFLTARTPVEKVLMILWTEVIGIDEIGIHDNFAELGGDSLIAAQIASRVNNTFRLKHTLNNLFETPTITQLSDYVIEHEVHPGLSDRIANRLLKIESMSVEEVTKAVLDMRGTRGNV
jgi:amino acid adenylation domain-containing protein